MDWPNFARRLLLAGGRIDASETKSIRRAVLASGNVDREVIFSDGHITEPERQFIIRLQNEADKTGKEFARLHDDVMRVHHTDVWG